eukprot:CAMPEP_0184695834 /NCGR_PEP_ID=MMETSP0313-20130426/3344_1 /TAXON_ID=2792 /ORGANISM="Porphyridium aerugineum, Strain SAG 1380-2" /LENGTH=631 /DNA_ID=CAMNT_0027154361 /DNA_START=180 /DNA_END=2075 /DNA_ORIENTATION=+
MKATFHSYVAASFLFAIGVIFYTINLKRYFYGIAVHLSKSKIARLALGNASIATILLCGKVVQYVFLGSLRFREQERLQIRIREAIIETCLAMTVFRDEFNAKFLGMFSVLLFVKVFHWLSRDRVENMEEQLHTTLKTHVKLVTLMTILFIMDIRILWACISYTVNNGPSMLVLFAFEFSVLVIWLISTAVKYSLFVADQYAQGQWDGNGMYGFYNELFADFFQLVVYIAFFMYVQAFYTLPLHIIRDIYLSFHKFQKRFFDFLRYRKVANTMNEMFADASMDDFEHADRICIICREEMQTGKKLHCSHIFHARCLQSWLRRQLNCPVCRASIEVPINRANMGIAAYEQAVAIMRRVNRVIWFPIISLFNMVRRLATGNAVMGHGHQAMGHGHQAMGNGNQAMGNGNQGVFVANVNGRNVVFANRPLPHIHLRAQGGPAFVGAPRAPANMPGFVHAVPGAPGAAPVPANDAAGLTGATATQAGPTGMDIQAVNMVLREQLAQQQLMYMRQLEMLQAQQRRRAQEQANAATRSANHTKTESLTASPSPGATAATAAIAAATASRSPAILESPKSVSSPVASSSIPKESQKRDLPTDRLVRIYDELQRLQLEVADLIAASTPSNNNSSAPNSS